MISPCEGQFSPAYKTIALLIGVILTWCIKHARAHQSRVMYISTYSELQDAWDPGSVQQTQHFVLTSHIDILPDTQDARPNRWFGTNHTGSRTQLMLSVQGDCSEPPPVEWRVDGHVAEGQCVLRFPENSNHTSAQLVRIEAAVPSQVDIWIANLYIISARLVDLYLPKGKGSIQGQVNLWTTDVTLQDTPTVASTDNDADMMIFPPHSKRHEGAAFINPCGPPLSTLSSTACIKCLVQGCRRSCTDGAALPGCNVGAPSAVAAITDAGTGSLLLQELTIAGCQSPVAHIVPHMCALPGAESLTRAPGSLHIYADGVSGATSQFNQTIINGAECAPQSSFLSAENPVSMDLQKHLHDEGVATGAVSVNASEDTASGIEQVPDPSSQRIFAAAPTPTTMGISPLSEQSAADGEPTWVIIGIVIASIAIAVLSLLLLLLLRPCKVHCQPAVRSAIGSAKSWSDKSTLTQPVDHSDAERGTPPSTAAEDSSRHGEDGAVAPALAVEVALQNAVDCGQPDARSAEWAIDPHSHEVIQASMHEHELSRQRIASELQVSLEQADMYMHHALGHKIPPFRDSSTSVTSGRSSRSYGMPNHGRPIDSLSAASLSAASAAAASSAAAAVANPLSESRESQRQPLPGGLYVHSNLSYATSAADPGYIHPQPEHFGVQQPVRGYGHSGAASPQWVHSAGSEASGRGFSMLPGWQEETQEQTPQRRQNVLPQPHGRPQRRRMSSGAQYAYSGAWGAVGPGSGCVDVSPVHPVAGSSMPPFHPRQAAELYEGDREALRAAQLDVRRWSSGAEQARVRELVDTGGLPGDWAGGGPGQAGGLMPQSRLNPMHQFTPQQRRHQERFALHEMQYRDAQRW